MTNIDDNLIYILTTYKKRTKVMEEFSQVFKILIGSMFSGLFLIAFNNEFRFDLNHHLANFLFFIFYIIFVIYSYKVSLIYFEIEIEKSFQKITGTNYSLEMIDEVIKDYSIKRKHKLSLRNPGGKTLIYILEKLKEEDKEYQDDLTSYNKYSDNKVYTDIMMKYPKLSGEISN